MPALTGHSPADNDFVAHKTIYQSLTQVGGIQFSVGCGIILLATFIPAGAFSWNPKVLNGVPLEGQEGFKEYDVAEKPDLDRKSSSIEGTA